MSYSPEKHSPEATLKVSGKPWFPLVKTVRDACKEALFGADTWDPETTKNADVSAIIGNQNLAGAPASLICVTQRKAQPDQLYLGWNGRVDLWESGSTINFAAYADGYPTKNHSIYAAQRLWEAAQLWNNVGLGVTFNWVKNIDDAEFVLAYGGNNDGTLASAFFPNIEDLNTIFVYKRSFDQDTVPYLANIFTHELGHVIGLRHEFAPSEGGEVLFGPLNPRSVMSYQFPPVLQDTDRTSTRVLYQYPSGSKVGDFPVSRVVPNN